MPTHAVAFASTRRTHTIVQTYAAREVLMPILRGISSARPTLCYEVPDRNPAVLAISSGVVDGYHGLLKEIDQGWEVVGECVGDAVDVDVEIGMD